MAFDLDDDELKATRRMNGSDKNVACMEEDIERLKRLFYANALTQYGKRKLIGYYEQQIKELEESSIPVSLVEEKIEELNKQLEEDLQDERKVNSNRFIIICQCKNCLQELLERRK